MIYRFDSFELDMARFELRECGKPCSLEPQVLALLAYLIEQRDRMVPKDELFEKLWDGRVVTDSTLASRVKSARKALGDDGKAQRFSMAKAFVLLPTRGRDEVWQLPRQLMARRIRYRLPGMSRLQKAAPRVDRQSLFCLSGRSGRRVHTTQSPTAYRTN